MAQGVKIREYCLQDTPRLRELFFNGFRALQGHKAVAKFLGRALKEFDDLDPHYTWKSAAAAAGNDPTAAAAGGGGGGEIAQQRSLWVAEDSSGVLKTTFVFPR